MTGFGPFVIEHGENSLSLFDVHYSEEDAANGNPYNTNAQLKVISRRFSGIGECEYDIKSLALFARQIREMYALRRSKVLLREICHG